MTRLYLVTSAIHTPFGFFERQERLYQTVATLDSIRRADPLARILLIEAGAQNLTKQELNILNPYMDDFVNLAEHPKVIKAHQCIYNHNVLKNAVESFALQFTMTLMGDRLEKMSRIFKISGRYLLQPSFDPHKHTYFKGKYVLAESISSPVASLNIGFDRYYPVRLWSMCPSLMKETLDYLQKTQELIVKWTSGRFYIDMEHAMYSLLNPQKVVNFSQIGVGGRLALNGRWIED